MRLLFAYSQASSGTKGASTIQSYPSKETSACRRWLRSPPHHPKSERVQLPRSWTCIPELPKPSPSLQYSGAYYSRHNNRKNETPICRETEDIGTMSIVAKNNFHSLYLAISSHLVNKIHFAIPAHKRISSRYMFKAVVAGRESVFWASIACSCTVPASLLTHLPIFCYNSFSYVRVVWSNEIFSLFDHSRI